MKTSTVGLAALLLTTTLSSGYAALGDFNTGTAIKATSLPGLQLARNGADDGAGHDANDDKGGDRDRSSDDSSADDSSDDNDDGLRGDGSVDDNSSSNDDSSSSSDDDGDDDRGRGRGRGSDDDSSSSDDDQPGRAASDDRKRIDLRIRDGEIRVRTRGLTEEEAKTLQEEVLRRLQGM